MSEQATRPPKPLGGKAYGSIPHLPGSRMGPADHHCHDGQRRICTEKARDRHDTIIVQEKLDGSCVSVAKVDGAVVALGRAGYPAASSPYEQHHLFAAWVADRTARFDSLLAEGERVVGEWLAQVHGTHYDLRGADPFVMFDLMVGKKRATSGEVRERAGLAGFVTPWLLHAGGPLPVDDALSLLGPFGFHGAIDPVEGVVYRVERKGAVDFLAKWVRPDKVDGCYLPELTGTDAEWNWRPEC